MRGSSERLLWEISKDRFGSESACRGCSTSKRYSNRDLVESTLSSCAILSGTMQARRAMFKRFPTSCSNELHDTVPATSIMVLKVDGNALSSSPSEHRRHTKYTRPETALNNTTPPYLSPESTQNRYKNGEPNGSPFNGSIEFDVRASTVWVLRSPPARARSSRSSHRPTPCKA